MHNIYYSPERFGLTQVAELEYSSGSYEFDTRVVWKHENGQLYTARDQGCSCPTPFEEYNSLDDLSIVDEVLLRIEARENITTDESFSTPADAHEFFEKIREARKER